MSHELTIRQSGKVEMAYVGETPWHGLGTLVPGNATIEDWVEAAGMEWTVESSPVEFDYHGRTNVLSDRKVLYRSDTATPLGVVSDRYNVVQPRETVEFFRDLIQSMGLSMATAGTLFDGKRFWATGYIGEDAVVDNRDLIKGYLLLSTSADGSLATTARFTTVRVVCNNTLSMAHQGAANVRVSHRGIFDAADVKKRLGLAPKAFESFLADMRTLAVKPVTVERATEMTEIVVGEKRIASRVMELFQGAADGSDLSGTDGTAWGWLNAVTQWADHDMRAKSESHRMNSSLFGRAADIKDKAYALAMA